MKKNTWIVIAAVMAVLLIGGSLLYRQLRDKNQGQQLQTKAAGEVTLPQAGPAILPGEGTVPGTQSAPQTVAEETPQITGAPAPAQTDPPAPGGEETPAPAQTADETQAADPSELAPDITFYDAAGNPIKLSDLRGKPVVLNLWASWCPPCREEMPYFQAKYEDLGEKIVFVMLNLTDGFEETKEKADAFVKENEFTFPVYYDTLRDAATTYQAYSIPRTFFIDSAGRLIAHAIGSLSTDVLQQGIDMIR